MVLGRPFLEKKQANKGNVVRYVLITAARNESRLIGRAIQSVLSQTILPEHWVIVSDASVDSTDEIVKSQSKRYPFIELGRLESGRERNFASQAYALNYAVSMVGSYLFDYIGCLDADILLEPRYYESIFTEFERDPLLGVAGGFIYERGRYGFGELDHAIRSVR